MQKPLSLRTRILLSGRYLSLPHLCLLCGAGDAMPRICLITTTDLGCLSRVTCQSGCQIFFLHFRPHEPNAPAEKQAGGRQCFVAAPPLHGWQLHPAMAGWLRLQRVPERTRKSLGSALWPNFQFTA